MRDKDTSSIEQQYLLIKMKEYLIREGKNNEEIEQILLEAGFDFSKIKQGFSNLAGNAIQGIKNAWNKPATTQQAQPTPATQQAQPAPAKQQAQPAPAKQQAQQGQKKRNPNLKFNKLNSILKKIGLTQYSKIFMDNELDDTLFNELENQDLKNIGITSLGHRKLLLQAFSQQPTAQTPAVKPAAVAAPKKAVRKPAAAPKKPAIKTR
jgi:glucan-binding YG repeat protein